MLTARQRLAGGRARCLLAATVAIVATGLSAAPALAASPLAIKMSHVNPFGAQGGFDPLTEAGAEKEGKAFGRESAGNAYTITVTNTGTEPTTGPATVKDKLPAGVVLIGSNIAEEAAGTGWECTVTNGGSESECSNAEPLLAGKSYEPITLHVYVGANTAPPATSVATVVNKASVSEGGVVSAETTEQEGETRITPAVPFGIASFATQVDESLGKPLVQPGGVGTRSPSRPNSYSTTPPNRKPAKSS